MSDNAQLLEQAQKFCDAETGEVIERIPEELMKELRQAKLARGVPGNRSKKTDSFATWYVFFTDEIRDRVMKEWRDANRSRKGKSGKPADKKPAKTGNRSGGSKPQHRPKASKGLSQFMQRRKTQK